MKNFSEFGLKTSIQKFTGEKIKITKILNKKITVHDYKMEDSKYEGKCLFMQITHDEEKRVVFTGAKGLIEMIEQIPKGEFPFATTIIEEDERYLFT